MGIITDQKRGVVLEPVCDRHRQLSRGQRLPLYRFRFDSQLVGDIQKGLA